MAPRKRQGITQADLGARLGLRPRQIRELTLLGMPRHPDTSYPFVAARDWYIRYKAESIAKRMPKAEEEGDEGKGHSLDYREQLAKVLLAEHRFRREEGKVVSTQLHRKRVAGLSQQFAAVIRSLPQYAPELVGIESMPDVTLILERIANDMLRLARGEEEVVVEDPAEEEPVDGEESDDDGEDP